MQPVFAAETSRIADAKENFTVCCFCSVGCGAIVHTKGDKMINLEGDPDNPINEGALCSKGQSMFQLANNKTSADEGSVPGSGRQGLAGERLGLDFERNRQESQGDSRCQL